MLMPRRSPRTNGFVLLEVLLSLMILGIAVAAFMRSFTQSLAAAKRIEVQSQAALLARKLMDQMEMTPPADGSSDGDFGTNYPAYTYRVTMEYEEPNYGKLDGDDGIEQYYAMRQVEIEINYDDKVHTPFQALRMTTALSGFEKFTYQSKQSYMNF